MTIVLSAMVDQTKYPKEAVAKREQEKCPLLLFCNDKDELCLRNNHTDNCTLTISDGNTFQITHNQALILKGKLLVLELGPHIITIEKM